MPSCTAVAVMALYCRSSSRMFSNDILLCIASQGAKKGKLKQRMKSDHPKVRERYDTLD